MKEYSKINIINDYEGTIITIEPTDKSELGFKRLKKMLEESLKELGVKNSRVELVEM